MKNVIFFSLIFLIFSCKKDDINPIPKVSKEYINTSYELSKTGFLDVSIPFVYDYASFDYDLDGDNDVLISDPNEIKTLVSHKVLYRNQTNKFNQEEILTINKVYFGHKPLVGDFNGDGYPDVFSLSAIDPPSPNNPLGLSGNVYTPNYMMFNSKNGFNRIETYSNYLGFWHSGASGDIDNDGDLDIVISNFSIRDNKTKNQIMWNDGKGNFTFDTNGIGDIEYIDRTELIDMNNDGYLDLIMNNVAPANENNVYYNDLNIYWGNGKNFTSTNKTKIDLPSDVVKDDNNKDFLLDLNAEDVNGDGYKDLILPTTYNTNGDWRIYIFKSNGSKSFSDVTSNYLDVNNGLGVVFHIKVQLIGGKLNIFSPYKDIYDKHNIRFEQETIGGKFIKKSVFN